MANFIEKSFRSMNSLGFHNVVYNDWLPANARDDNRIIIGVHGLTCNGHDFDPLAEALTDQGYRFIAVDLPGRGRSDYLPNPMDYTPIQYARDLAALFAHLDIKDNQSIDWIGVSLGGILGIALAGVQNSPIGRLIINDVGPDVPAESITYIKDVILQPRHFNTVRELEQDLRQTHRVQWGPMSDDQWHHMAEHNARAMDDGTITHNYDLNIAVPFQDSMEGTSDIMWHYWDQISCPVMLIRGADSKLLTPDIVQNMQTRGPGPKMHFLEFEGCGHVPSLCTPDQISSITSWLGSTQTS